MPRFSSHSAPVFAYAESSYAQWAKKMGDVIAFVKQIAISVELLTVQCEANMMVAYQYKLAGKELKPMFEKSADPFILACELLEKKLVEFYELWKETEEIFDSFVWFFKIMIRCGGERFVMMNGRWDGVKIESGEETKERLASIVRSVGVVARYSKGTKERNFIMNCHGNLRNVAAELEKELGWRSRKIYTKETTTLPVIVNAFVRDAMGECSCQTECE